MRLDALPRSKKQSACIGNSSLQASYNLNSGPHFALVSCNAIIPEILFSIGFVLRVGSLGRMRLMPCVVENGGDGGGGCISVLRREFVSSYRWLLFLQPAISRMVRPCIFRISFVSFCQSALERFLQTKGPIANSYQPHSTLTIHFNPRSIRRPPTDTCSGL